MRRPWLGGSPAGAGEPRDLLEDSGQIECDVGLTRDSYGHWADQIGFRLGLLRGFLSMPGGCIDHIELNVPASRCVSDMMPRSSWNNYY